MKARQPISNLTSDLQSLTSEPEHARTHIVIYFSYRTMNHMKDLDWLAGWLALLAGLYFFVSHVRLCTLIDAII